jgi:hypothetical protein
MAGRLTTTGAADGQRTGQQIEGNRETAEEVELALTPAGRLGAFWVGKYLEVIILQEIQKHKRMF